MKYIRHVGPVRVGAARAADTVGHHLAMCRPPGVLALLQLGRSVECQPSLVLLPRPPHRPRIMGETTRRR